MLLKHIEKIHADPHMKTYGSPRVHAELTMGLGLPVNPKRVARLMRAAGIQGLCQRRRRGCTVRDTHAEPAADLVNRQFTADAPNRLWVTDITEHPTGAGRLYCAAVMDAFSRRIVGWSIAEHIRTELVLDATTIATGSRGPGTGASTGRCTSWLSSNCGTTPKDAATTGADWPPAKHRWKPCARSNAACPTSSTGRCSPTRNDSRRAREDTRGRP